MKKRFIKKFHVKRWGEKNHKVVTKGEPCVPSLVM